jgi:hypothetical protein
MLLPAGDGHDRGQGYALGALGRSGLCLPAWGAAAWRFSWFWAHAFFWLARFFEGAFDGAMCAPCSAKAPAAYLTLASDSFGS